MANSTLSLDSLSSPSPSPSPPPEPTKVAQLDPDSELSELTDDDQDASDAIDKRPLSSVKEHDNTHPMPSTSSSKVSRRGTHQRSSSRRGGAVGRKKRSSIVPAPMWGWAENKAASTSSAAAPVEEEEEEMSGPPRAMEEEEEEEAEEEEEDEEPEDGDFGVNENVEPGRGHGPQRRIGSYTPQRYNGISYPPSPTRHWVQQRPRRARKGWRQPDEEPKEHDDQESPDHKPDDSHNTNNKNSAATINGGDDEGSASGSPYPSTSRKKRPTKQRAPLPSSSSSAALRKRKEGGGDDNYSGSERPAHPLKKKKNERVQHDEDELSDVSAPAIPAPPLPPPQASSDNENTESEEEPFVLPPAVASPLTTKPISPIVTIIATNNDAAEAMSALAALAVAADSIDIMDPIPHLNSTSTTSSIISGFGSGPLKSLEVPAALPTSVTTGANLSRSPSPAGKSDADASSAEDEPRPTRSKARDVKSAMKGKGGNIKGKAGDKNTGVVANGTEASTNATTKKGPPPPLNIKTDTHPDEPPSLPAIDTTVEDDVNDRSLDDREDVDMDDPEEEEEEEEEEEAEEEEEVEEPEEEQVDEEANEVDEDIVDPEGDDDQEQDGADNENEDMEEGENGDENENENPSPDGDADGDEHEESDLQPAHRAEALDVLATIELKFALLRERLYVEKMEGLAWEERMIQASVHPEMQHLQKELTKRRDKRLELASRKRSYEVANASKRRRADEDGVWSWWKFARDELQTDMISETNRKRRRLERERRAIERPQPIRRIPLHAVALDMHNPPPLPPTLRKIIKSYPFGTRKQNKSEGHSHHHNHHLLYSKAHYVYPEISTLSAVDIANDLEFLVQNRRMNMGMGTSAVSGVYEVQQHQQPQMQQQQHYTSQQQPPLYNPHQQPPVPQRNGPVMGMGMGSRTVNNVGLGMNNGVLPPQVQAQVQQQPSQMGPPPPNNSMMHPHPHQPPPQHSVSVGYEHQYVSDLPPFGPSGVGGRMKEPQPMNMNSYPQQQHGLPPLGHLPPPPSQPTTKSRDPSYPAYTGGPGPGGRIHQSSHGPPLPMPGNSAHSHHGHAYGKDHEKAQGPGGPGPGPSNNNGPGGGHHHHTYFGQGGSGVGAYGPSSSSSHMSGSGINGSRSMSPVHVMSNGSGSGKPNGMWMGGYHPGSGSGKGGGGGEWGMHEGEEREMREREREKERERDRDDRERTRYRDRDRDREHQEHERERQRDHQHIQQQHRQPPLYGGSGAPPPQGPGVVPHHQIVPSHHHHRPLPHHHHVVHHHHGQGQSHTATSLPPGSVGSAPIVHSPRSTRDYDSARPPQLHPGPSQPHSSEVIMLSSGSKSSQPQLHPRDREREPWSGKSPDEQHHNPTSSTHEYRERDLIREMDNRKMHSRRSSGPPMLPLEERDRPMAMPFVIPPSHPMQQAPAPNSHLGSSSAGTSPRGAPPNWNMPSSYDDTPRIQSSSAPGYLNSPRAHDAVRSPIQSHRYAPPSSTGSGMGRHITTGSSSSSSGLHHMISTPPPSRARPPPSPSYSNPLSKSHRSPATSPRLRPLSSPAPSNPSSKLHSALPTGSGYSSSPRLSGPGLTSTPTGHHPSSISLLSTNTPSSQTDVITKNGTQQQQLSSSYPINSRNTSPLMSSLHAPLLSPASGRPPSGGSGLDRDRERHSTGMVLSPRVGPSSHPPPLSKMSTAQTVDGH